MKNAVSFLFVISTLFAALFMNPASADPVDINLSGFTFTPAKIVTFLGNDYMAGGLTGLIDGDQFEAWCAEPSQFIRLNTTYTYDKIAANPGPLTDLLASIGGFILDGNIIDSTIGAAVQLDIWAAIYNQPLVNLYATRDDVDVFYLRNANHQDLITFTTIPLPEPMPLALMGAGLLGIGFTRRVKR